MPAFLRLQPFPSLWHPLYHSRWCCFMDHDLPLGVVVCLMRENYVYLVITAVPGVLWQALPRLFLYLKLPLLLLPTTETPWSCHSRELRPHVKVAAIWAWQKTMGLPEPRCIFYRETSFCRDNPFCLAYHLKHGTLHKVECSSEAQGYLTY